MKNLLLLYPIIIKINSEIIIFLKKKKDKEKRGYFVRD